MSPRTRSLVILAACLCAALGFARLGIWQLRRLAEGRALNRPAAAARALPVVSLDDPVDAASLVRTGADNRRLRVTGRYDHAAEIIVREQSKAGVPGVRVVTPLRPLRGDTAILVQRGYVASPDGQPLRLSALEEPGVREVEGIAFVQPVSGVAGEPVEQAGQLTWRRLDLEAVRQRLPYPIHPFLLLQLPDTALPALPARDLPPELSDGPHLVYAILWFAFALAVVLAGSSVWLRRPGRAGALRQKQSGRARR